MRPSDSAALRAQQQRADQRVEGEQGDRQQCALDPAAEQLGDLQDDVQLRERDDDKEQ
jgi:hypothetical protein